MQIVWDTLLILLVAWRNVTPNNDNDDEKKLAAFALFFSTLKFSKLANLQQDEQILWIGRWLVKSNGAPALNSFLSFDPIVFQNYIAKWLPTTLPVATLAVI